MNIEEKDFNATTTVKEDVNGDGKVNALDIQQVINVAAASEWLPLTTPTRQATFIIRIAVRRQPTQTWRAAFVLYLYRSGRARTVSE